MISFDTDMIGPYGYCADLSRSWTCGYVAMSNKQRELYSAALEQIDHNLSLVRDGLTFAEFNERSWRIPERFQPYRYSLAAHGVVFWRRHYILGVRRQQARRASRHSRQTASPCIIPDRF